MGELLVVQSKVKELAKKLKLRMAGDAVGAISKAVEEVVKAAAVRAKANKRQTIKASDI
jgi:histone H3/H4